MENRTNIKQEINLKEFFAPYRTIIDTKLRRFVLRGRKHSMYKQMAYFLGFLDEDFKEIDSVAGKRFRPGLTLLLAEYYGNMNSALGAALSIELFHNFTLIHDDIVDNDEMRRGRPTVWKLWGKKHAINTGDAQHALSNTVLGEENITDPKIIVKIQQYLNDRYLEIAEGQFLDFVLTDSKLGDPIVNKETYIEMIIKKAAVLVGAATAVAGIANNQSEKEEKLLYEYGLNLGIAYQLYDDFASIWKNTKKTGKVILGDIYERKKTLPILYTLQNLSQTDASKFTDLYNTDDKEKTTTDKIFSYIEKAGAYEFMKKEISRYVEKANETVFELSLPTSKKETLCSLNKALVTY